MSFKKFIFAIFMLTYSEIALSSICKPPNIFYHFFELGACLPDDTSINKERYDNSIVFNVLYKNTPIRVELGGRQNGNIYTILGKDFDREILHNLPPMSSYFGNGNEIHKWGICKQRLSVSIFSTSNSNVMINYQGSDEQEKLGEEFMYSLFLICKQDEAPNIDHCVIINNEHQTY